jgi:hypothetical protein
MSRVLILAAVLTGGCGAPPVSGAPSFADEPMQALTSASGRLSVEVWTWPSPLTKGVDAVRLRVTGADGAPVDGAGVSATPWMVAHGHGTSVVPRVTERGAGIYDVEEISFYMAGRWELRGAIVDPAGAADTFTAPLDVH